MNRVDSSTDVGRLEIVHQLFLLNLTLQLFDGVASYFGVAAPGHEGNPLVAAAMRNLGIGMALLLFKTAACAALVLLRSVAGAHPIAARALAGLAAAYGCLSFVPWTARNVLLL
jgi:hypothetical protein